jgi:hypothetical protein
MLPPAERECKEKVPQRALDPPKWELLAFELDRSNALEAKTP